MSGKNPNTRVNSEDSLLGRMLPKGGAIAALAGIAFSALCSSGALAADALPLPIKSISLDKSKQLVIQFGTHAGSFPAVPHVLDLPGPNHRIVLDFADASLDKVNLPSPEELTSQFGKAIPAIKGVRYNNLTNTPKPTARLVLDLPEDVKAAPKIISVDESSITVNLGSEVENAKQAADADAAPDTTATAGGAESKVAADDTAAAPAPALAPVADAAAAPAPVSPAPTTTAAKPTASGSWDWSSAGMNGTPTPSEIKDISAPPLSTTPVSAPVPATQVAAPAADSVDGVAPSSSQANQVPELKPAISQTAAPQASDADQVPSALPPQAAAPAQAPAQGAPEVSSTGNQAAVKLYNSAVKNHLKGQLADAIADYKGALAANPSLSEAHSNLGLIYNQQHDYTQALSEFRKALAINPKDAITYNGIGAALRAQHDLLGAIKNWQTAVSLDPHLATAHYNLGTAYEIQKDYDRAQESYKQAVKNDYRLGEAYYRLGLILERKHQVADAAAQFRQALKASGAAEYSEDARQRLGYLQKGKTM